MANTVVDLYRSIRIEQFPDGVFDGKDPAEGVLYPDFYARDLGEGKTRAADVTAYSPSHFWSCTMFGELFHWCFFSELTS